ncbi:hypothetical protein ZWY2020_032860 [Hordeum vulgare]|nr:hypothetical protein ZWY2020_032860 [Hordeum vulgare]
MRLSANQPREGPGPWKVAPLPGPQQPPLYIAVADGCKGSGFRYTRPVLQCALRLMGCKPRHAFKEDGMKVAELLEADNMTNIPFKLYKTQTTAVASREEFLDVVCDALTLYKYVGRNQRADLLLACRCPYYKMLNDAVEYRGVKTKEEKGVEQIEEQRVIEAQIRMRHQELEDDVERLKKKQLGYVVYRRVLRYYSGEEDGLDMRKALS